MKYFYKITIILLLFSICFCNNGTAQISINTDGSDPDASAILDIKSNDKGLLIPRMDSTSRKAIVAPAKGLMVYDSTTSTFWYYDKTQWNELLGQNSKISIENIDNLPTSDYPCLDLVQTVSLFRGQPATIVSKGDYIYIGDDGLSVVDISEPTNPILTNTIDLLGLTSSDKLAISGNFVYAATVLNESGLNVIDISDPYNVSVVGFYDLSYKFVNGIVAQGNYVYTTDQVDKELKVFDVSDPNNPMLINSVNIGTIDLDLGISGNHVFVTESKNDSLYIFDISNPYDISTTAVISLSSFDIRSVLIDGGYLYLLSEHNLEIIDISSPTNPVSLSITDFAVVSGVSFTDITVKGSLAYISDKYLDEVKVVNISNPTNPTSLKSLPISGALDPYGIEILGEYAFVVDMDARTLFSIRLDCDPLLLGVDLENQTISPSSFSDIDDQFIDQFTLSNDTLFLSLENDGAVDKTVDLSGYKQALSLSNDSLYLENGGSVDLGTLSKTFLSDADGDTKIDVGTSNQVQFTVQSKDAFSLGLVNESEFIFDITTPGKNTFIGSELLQNLTISNNRFYGNIFLGQTVGNNLITNNNALRDNIIMGTDAGREISLSSSLSDNIVLGGRAGYKLTGGDYNIFMGYQSGFSTTSGYQNIFLGDEAGFRNTTGTENIFIGREAGRANRIGNDNVFIGEDTGHDMEEGYDNVAIGPGAFRSNLYAEKSIAIGHYAGFQVDSSYHSIFIGNYAGKASADSSAYNIFIGDNAGQLSNSNNSIFIGKDAGKWEINDYRLHIENNDHTTPLIYGEFDNDFVRINGDLEVTGTLTGAAFSDNLGNHTATQNIDISNHYLSEFGGNNGIRLDARGFLEVRGQSGSNGAIHLIPGASNQNSRIYFNDETEDTKWNIGYVYSSDNFNILDQTQSSNTTPLTIEAGSDDNMLYLANSGNVGIGTNNPTTAKLVIKGTGIDTSFSSQVAYLNANGVTIASSGLTNTSYSIFADGRVGALSFHGFSDERIKSIIGRSNSKTDLATLNQIQITDYTMKDNVLHGHKAYKKVIAQQVAKVFPQAISNNNLEIVPDIFKTTTIDKNGWIASETDLQKGDKVKIIFEKGEELLEVLELKSNMFRVQPSTVNRKPSTVFVYGRQVNDFHTVDYEAISMLNVSATQQLAKENNALKEKLAQQNQRIQNLEQQAAKVTQLETMLLELKAQLFNNQATEPIKTSKK